MKSENIIKLIRAIVVIAFIIGIVFGDSFAKLVLAVLLFFFLVNDY